MTDVRLAIPATREEIAEALHEATGLDVIDFAEDMERAADLVQSWLTALRAQVAKLEAENKELKEPEWFIDVVDGETYESVDILLDDFAQPWKPRHIEGARHAGGFFAARVWSGGNDGEGGGESVILSGPTAEDVQSQIDALKSKGNENG